MSKFRLPQEVTFWIPITNDGMGGKTWELGVKTAARIAPTSDIVFTEEGKEITANKAVYTRVDVPELAYVIEGDFAGSSEPVDGAQQVIKASSNSTMTDMFRALLQ